MVMFFLFMTFVLFLFLKNRYQQIGDQGFINICERNIDDNGSAYSLCKVMVDSHLASYINQQRY